MSEVPGHVGLLQQDPLVSVVAETVGRDVAFGLENRQVSREEIWPRVQLALEASAFPYGVGHPTSALSGGEAQRLALAGSLVLGSPVMLLDEPTSMLDPELARSVREAVRRDADSRRATTVVVEHHIEPWLDFADRLIVLGEGGSVVADGDPGTVLAEQTAFLTSQGVWVPGADAPSLAAVDPALVSPWASGPQRLVSATDIRVELKGGLVDRRAAPTVALDGVAAVLDAGKAVGVTGVSGAGKSTLVSVLGGLLKPTSGTVVAAPELATKKGAEPWRWASPDLTARLSWMPQTPEHGVVSRSVQSEVLASARACGREPRVAEHRAGGLLEVFGLSHLADASPYHLSGGEQRRLMVAAALTHGPYGVLLDEPTVGQDRRTWSLVLGAVAAARNAGSGVAVATHDMLAVDAIADEVLTLDRVGAS